ARGLQKVKAAGEAARITLARADAMRLPVADRSVDAVTVAFGIRNVQRPEIACGEMARVLRSGGRVAILELGVPRIPGMKRLYLWSFMHALPRAGRLLSGHSAACSYLPVSAGGLPPPARSMPVPLDAGRSA